MEKHMETYVIPKSLSNEDLENYLPWEPVAAIWGISKRRVSGVVNEEQVTTRYFNKNGSMDYVCYRIADVLRVARQRTRKWPEVLKDIVKVGDTYPEARRKPNEKSKAQNEATEVPDSKSREQTKKDMIETIEKIVNETVNERLSQIEAPVAIAAPIIKFKRSHKIIAASIIAVLTAGLIYGGVKVHNDTVAQLEADKSEIIGILNRQKQQSDKAMAQAKAEHEKSMTKVMAKVQAGFDEVKAEVHTSKSYIPFWLPFQNKTTNNTEE